MLPKLLFRLMILSAVTFTLFSGCGGCKNNSAKNAVSTTPTPVLSEVLLTPGKTFEKSAPSDVPFRMFRLLSTAEANLNYSPLSAEMAFYMLNLAAHGKTQDEFQKIFNFKKDAPFAGEFEEAGKSNPTHLIQFANGVFTKSDDVLKSYSDRLSANLKGEVHPLKLEAINAWVSDQTKGKIPSILSELPKNLSTVFVNALYFKMAWGFPFDVKMTKLEMFQSSLNQSMRIDMMSLPHAFKYFEDEVSQWVELPYADAPFSMVVILPKKRFDLRSVEDQFSSEAFEHHLTQLKSTFVNLSLPKFTFKTGKSLRSTLEQAGYGDLFRRGDFSGFSKTGHPVNLSQVFQETTIEVTEAGTEASAATAMATEGMAIVKKDFKADQPFLFVIRNQNTNEIYFMGKVYDPQKN